MVKEKRGYKFITTVVAVAAALIVVTSTALLPLLAIAATLRLQLPELFSALLPMQPAAFC